MTGYTKSDINDAIAATHFNTINNEKRVASAALRAGSSVGGERMQQYKDLQPLETEEIRQDGTVMFVERHANGEVRRFYEKTDANGETWFRTETDDYCPPLSNTK
ncbi:hypothetical protein [Photobacterium aquimaris]|uniref:Uncharacterized protein n=1 Tax=Photobacterium aquimaris TaxID=512643 RepID=A0A2T3I0I7_9GAMM|nr:hypothetical protein [Photobacterium aquimaris]OBU25579.1 hypothetical protein AYY21_08335 [Photobacterium aquimaris]PQJ37122.1 hypothetical protein BTN98_18450 [Photobacterium aquimaris]PSU10022.1 hypothetical protein C0W81_04685 [Photobacterium aquimaris]